MEDQNEPTSEPANEPKPKSKRKTQRSRRGRGESSIRFCTKRKLWVASSSITVNGKRTRPTVYGKSKGEAFARLQKKLERLANPPAISDTISLADYLDRWIGLAKDRLKRSTHKRYVQHIDHIKKWDGAKLQLGEIKPSHIEDLLNHLADSSASNRRKVYVCLRNAFNSAVKARRVGANPCDGVEEPKAPPREIALISEEDARKILDATRHHKLFGLVALGFGTGARLGELLSLRWMDLDLAASKMKIERTLFRTDGQWLFTSPKSKTSRRTVTLPAELVELLRSIKPEKALPEALVFTTRNGTPLAASNIRKHLWLPALRRAKIAANYRFHDLRHYHASTLISRGCSIKAISSRLGHASIAITLTVYGHLMPTDDEKLAIAANDLFAKIASANAPAPASPDDNFLCS